MEFDLSFLDKASRDALQIAIDAVNKACVLHDCGAWNYISAGNLIQASEDRWRKPLDDVAECIFSEMDKEGYSGYTALWTIFAVTRVAKNFRKWRNEVIVNSLVKMKDDLNNYIERIYREKFVVSTEDDWFARLNKVLHYLEYSFLASYILSEDDRNLLQYILKMENVSHLGNEVLLEQIDEQLRIL